MMIEREDRLIVRVDFHPNDARIIMEICDEFGIDPQEFIKIAAMRYVYNLKMGVEAPPGRGRVS